KIGQLSSEVDKLRTKRDALAAKHQALESFDSTRLETDERTLDLAIRAKPYLDRWLPNDPFATMVLALGAVMAGTVLKGVFLVASTYTVGRLTQLTIFDLRNEFFRHVLRMDLHVFDQDRSSGLVSRSTYDFDRLAEGIGGILSQGIREPIKMLTCLVGAALICWQLLIVSLLMVPLGWGLIRLLSRIIKQTTKMEMTIVHALYHRLDESFQGIKTIRVFGRERHERRRLFLVGKRFLRQTRQLFFVSLFKPVGETMGMAGVTAAVLAGSYLVLQEDTQIWGIQLSSGPLDAAALMLFYAFLVGLSDPARKLSAAGSQLYVGAAAAERITAFMQMQPAIVDPPRPKVLATIRPDVEFSKVSFQYQADQLVLREVDLGIPFGRTVAIVGPNGCGKSTLVNLIPRLYDPLKGKVSVGGIDVRNLAQRKLRNLVGVVAQDTVLFDDTVRENIRYGKPDARDEEVVEAARKAHVHDCIERVLPEGYDTVVGQKGSRLSSGQRQRIALARVILRDPKILILDEATSHIDMESERLIHTALETFLEGRTTILVTHRPSALRLADVIVVMDEGRIVDSGTSSELLARCGVYQRLYERELLKAA
ncbi:MAG: ABC transporter ATP-binding protein, partial [Pirellulales bacterium]